MFPNLGPMEMMIVMGLAVLMFGKRLPEVGRSLGKGIVEFKKGLNEVTSGFDDVSSSISDYSSPYQAPKQTTTYEPPRPATPAVDETVPKFEVPGAVSTTATTAESTPSAPA